MSQGTSSTRVATEVALWAAAVAEAEDRSVAEQITYWARIGMQVERSGSVAARRLRAVVSGDAQFATLSEPERATAHALIDAQIAGRVSRGRFGARSRSAGQTTVSVDDDGRLIEITPDGRTRHL